MIKIRWLTIFICILLGAVYLILKQSGYIHVCNSLRRKRYIYHWVFIFTGLDFSSSTKADRTRTKVRDTLLLNLQNIHFCSKFFG